MLVGVSGYELVSQSTTVAPNSSGAVSVFCPLGKVLMASSYLPTESAGVALESLELLGSATSANGRLMGIDNNSPLPVTVTARASCILVADS